MQLASSSITIQTFKQEKRF